MEIGIYGQQLLIHIGNTLYHIAKDMACIFFECNP